MRDGAGKGSMEIQVVHFFDNNYVIPAAVSFYSMLTNASKEHDYVLYVGHSDITAKNQIKLEELVSNFSNAKLKFINLHNKFANLFTKTKWGGLF